MLEDIAAAGAFILGETTGRSLADYGGGRLLRSAIERNFEIIGEALLRLERSDPLLVQSISDYRQIIGFRNPLAHGYDVVRNAQIWDLVRHYLPMLMAEVAQLLGVADEPWAAG